MKFREIQQNFAKFKTSVFPDVIWYGQLTEVSNLQNNLMAVLTCTANGMVWKEESTEIMIPHAYKHHNKKHLVRIIGV